MSTTIDQRVVEMQFDNAHFERNVATTMSSLDKLKQSLRLSDASKGFEDVSAAAKGVNLSGLGSAAETVGLKFSAMYSIADQALRNITNSAMNAGKRIVSALTIDPIKTGFQEYETQINAVQTILANTKSKGTTLDDVNSALDELNTYADKTIYNFTEMTRNIGTFTAAGVDLDTSVNAIQGIANLAAVSGSTSQQASTAMYQLSQALAAGTVKLMDWNSVVNAGMGGEMFQNALRETSELLGTGAEAAIKAEGSFRESLKNGWLTSEVLTETLKKFTSTGAVEQVAKYTGLSKEAVSAALDSAKAQYGEADAIEHASKALAEKSGKSAEEIKSTLEFARTAEDAATKVKTFSQLWDTLKESAQSGWTQTWEIIVGDFEEAKEMFTKVSDTIGGMLAESAEARNKLLSGALGEESATPFKDFKVEMLELSDAQLKEAGYTEKQIATLRRLASTAKATGKPVSELIEKFTRPTGRELLIDSLWNAFDAVLKIIKPVKEAFREVFPAMTSERLYEIIKGLNEFTKSLIISDETADKIKTTFKGVFSVIDIGVTFIKEIGSGILELLSHFTGLGGGVLGITSSFGEWLTNLRDTIKETDILGTSIDKVVGFLTKIITKLKEFGSSVKESFASSGYEGFVGFLKLSWEFLSKIAKSFGNAFMSITEALIAAFDGSYIDNLINTGLFAGLIMGIKKVVDTLKDILDGGGGFLENITGILEDVRSCFEAYQNSLNAETLKKIATAIGILAASILVISLIEPSKLEASLGTITVLFAELLGSMAIFTKISGAGLKGVLKAIPLMIGMSTAVLILAGALKVLSSLDAESAAKGLLTIGVLMAEISIFLRTAKFDGKIASAAVGIVIISSAMLILAKAVKNFGGMNWDQLGKGLASIGVLLGELAIFTRIAGKANNIVSTGVSMVLLGAAMKILASAVKDFSGMNWDEIGRGLTAMGIALGAITLAMRLMPTNMLSVGAGFTIVSAAMLILAEAMKSFSGMSWDEIGRGITVMGVALLELVIALNLMNGTLAGSAALIIAAGALAILAPVMKTLGNLTWGQIAKGLISLAGAFAVVGIAGLLLAPLLPTILGLAAAFALFGVATVGIGAGLTLIGIGLSAIATGFTALAVAGTAGATAVVSALSIIILGIADLIPQIAEKLGEAVIAFAKVIGDCAPQLAEAVLKLILEVLEACEEYAPKIVDSLLGFLIGVLDALSDRMPELITSAVEFIGSFFKGVADALSGIDTKSLFEGIIGVALMSGLMMALSAVASLIPGAMVGVLGMGVVIAELALVLAAIGALAQLPGLEWLINEGGDLLQSIGTAIGQFFGGIVGGLAEGATSTLPQVGTNLSDFMTNAKPFFDGVKSIDPSALDGVKTIVDIVKTLTAAGIIDSIMSWATGESSLTSFGEQLIPFGESIAEFSRIISADGAINETAVMAVANAGKILAEMATLIPNTGGVAAFFAGDNGLDTFGTQIVAFGEAMVGFSRVVSADGAINESAILATASAGKILAEMAALIPNTGGVVSWFAGDNGLDTFGTQLVAFGSAMVSFSSTVAGKIDEGVIVATATAGKVLAELAASLPNTGGVVSWFAGDNGLDTFGTQIVTFGEAMVNFSDTIKGIDESAVIAAANVGATLATLAKSLPKSGGFGSVFTADNDLSTFGSEIEKFGESMAEFSEDVSGVDTGKMSKIVTQFNRIIALVKDAADIDLSAIDNISDALDELGDISIDEFVESFNDASAKVSDAVTTLITALKEGIASQKDTVSKVFVDLIKNVLVKIKNEGPAFHRIGSSTTMEFVRGIASKNSSAREAAIALASYASNGLKSARRGFESAGKNLGDGLIVGINSKKQAVYDAAFALGQKAVQGEKDGQASKSPSKLTIKAGKWLGEGLVIGIERMANQVYKSGSNLGKTATNSISSAIRNLSDMVNTDIDAQPTIRPVLDLSDVRSGAGAIGKMFNADASVGVMANVTAINSMMNNRVQNGTNDDIISAIKELRSELGGMDRATYNINGVTYDDGSNISDAVRTIVRAARIERRS